MAAASKPGIGVSVKCFLLASATLCRPPELVPRPISNSLSKVKMEPSGQTKSIQVRNNIVTEWLAFADHTKDRRAESFLQFLEGLKNSAVAAGAFVYGSLLLNLLQQVALLQHSRRSLWPAVASRVLWLAY